MGQENEQAQSGGERRHDPREKHFSLVEYSILVPNHGKGKLRDISPGGIGVIFDRYIPAGTTLKVKYNLPFPEGKGKNPIYAIGKVIWCAETEEGYLAGIQLLSVL